MLSPGLNIMRTPLNGRNCEYLGEDPYVTSRMAVGFITALQSHGVAACAKPRGTTIHMMFHSAATE